MALIDVRPARRASKPRPAFPTTIRPAIPRRTGTVHDGESLNSTGTTRWLRSVGEIDSILRGIIHRYYG